MSPAPRGDAPLPTPGPAAAASLPARDGVVETARLRLRHLGTDDAGFIRELLNDPDFLRNIGDKGVRSHEDALRYLQEGPLASYAQFGFGLLAVERRPSSVPIGICGLLQRTFLPDPDLGFAFLPSHRGQGYATEAARGVLDWAHARALPRVLALTLPSNTASIRLLTKLGLEYQRMIAVPGSAAACQLFALHGKPAAQSGHNSRLP